MDQLASSDRWAPQRRLGVVDGLGPRTTARFYAMLCETHRALTGGSYPDVVVHTIGVQRRLVDAAAAGSPRPAHQEALRDLVTRTSRSLAGTGADVITVACNATTVDPALGALTCIGMVEATGRKLQRLNVRRVGLVASSIMVSSAAYERGLGDAGIAVVAPTPGDQEIVDRFIESLQWSTAPVPVPEEFRRVVAGFGENVDALILDCNELYGVVDAEMAGKPVVDSVTALVEEASRLLVDPVARATPVTDIESIAAARPSRRWALSRWRPHRPQRGAAELIRIRDIA